MFEMSIVPLAALILIVSVGLAFGFLFGLDVLSKGLPSPDQIIEDIGDVNNAHEIILNCLNTKIKYNEKEIDIADLVIISIKNNNYNKLKEELEKNLNLPKTHWLLRIEADEKKLWETKRDGWTTYKEAVEGKNTHRFDLLTPLSDYPKLRLTFSIREGEKA